MNLPEYWLAVGRRFGKSSERYGQAAFNQLNEVRKDLADKVAGTDMDPFYMVESRWVYWEKFVNFVADNWGDEEEPDVK